MSPIRRGREDAGERRRTSHELDRLLDGDVSGDARLDEVLSAAGGPAREHELASVAPTVGSSSTVTESPASSGRRVLTRLGAATLVTKAVTGTVGALVVGAAAVAGATHHLPGQSRPRPVTVAPSPTTGSSATSPTRSRTSSSTAPSRTDGLSASPSTGATSAVGVADIPALCRVWLSLSPTADAARRDPRFVVLIRTAGGVQAVTPYCRALPLPSASATPSTGNTRTGPGRGSTPTALPSVTTTRSTPRVRTPARSGTPTRTKRSSGG